jgi:hypothetical protein
MYTNRFAGAMRASDGKAAAAWITQESVDPSEKPL